MTTRDNIMEINKLTNNINGHISGSKAAEGNQEAQKVSSRDKTNGFSDKVSLDKLPSGKNEDLFAKIELEKLNQSSFGKLKDYKAKIEEYKAAKEISPEAASKTEIGQMINDPEVWGAIADKIQGE